MLWEEYRAVNPEGYGRTQFFEIYRQHAKTLHPVMRFSHKAGDKLFVDFSGDRPHYVNQETGEIIYAELFVAVLGASSYTFAVAVADQQIPNWIKAHVLAFEYFGGVPACLVPDNLKSAVTLPCKYDPVLNPVYMEMAAHYQVAVMPARPYKARDKAKVESGVLCDQRRILAVFRNRTFFSLREVNVAIAEELEKVAIRIMLTKISRAKVSPCRFGRTADPRRLGGSSLQVSFKISHRQEQSPSLQHGYTNAWK